MDETMRNNFRKLVIKDFVSRYKKPVIDLSQKLIKYTQSKLIITNRRGEFKESFLQPLSVVVKFSNYDLGTDVLSNLMKVFSDIQNGSIMVDMLKFTYALYVHPISVNKLSC